MKMPTHLDYERQADEIDEELEKQEIRWKNNKKKAKEIIRDSFIAMAKEDTSNPKIKDKEVSK